MLNTLPEVIRSELARVGRTQAWLAREAQVSRACVSQWMKHSRRPSLETLGRVAAAFGHSTSDFVRMMEAAGA